MKLRRITALLLLVILAVQVLPVKQAVSLFSNNQFNEELCLEKEIKEQPAFKEPLFLHNETSLLNNLLLSKINYLHFSVSLPASHAADVTSPPPDIA